LFSLKLLATRGFPEIAAHNTIRKTPDWGSDAESWSKNDFAAYVFLAECTASTPPSSDLHLSLIPAQNALFSRESKESPWQPAL
jgi:hypothetical protein